MIDDESSLLTITLTAEETQQALEIGSRRHNSSESHGYLQSDGSKSGNGLVNHQRGAASEIAVSKYLGIPWDATVDGYQSVPDIANVIEVRGRTAVRPYLRLKHNDQVHKSERLFVSVERLGEQRFRLDGWIEGKEGMLDIYFVPEDPDSHKSEWHVPLEKLSPPRSLENALKDRLGDVHFEKLKSSVVAAVGSHHNGVQASSEDHT